MTDEERVAFIRRGNELFNNGDYLNALKVFIATDYKDGLIRVADYLYFDKKDKVSAVKLYKKAGHQKVIDDFAEKAAAVIRTLLMEDEQEKKIEEERKINAAQILKEWKPITLSAADISGTKNIEEKEGEKE